MTVNWYIWSLKFNVFFIMWSPRGSLKRSDCYVARAREQYPYGTQVVPLRLNFFYINLTLRELWLPRPVTYIQNKDKKSWAVRLLFQFREGTTLRPGLKLSKNAARKWPLRVLTWPIRVNTVVPYGLGLGSVVITTLWWGPFLLVKRFLLNHLLWSLF